MLQRRRTLVVTIAVVAVALSAWACEIRVRDSAFRTVRDLHRLCVIADSSDKQADALQARLEQWLDAKDGTLNLEIVRIDADDPEVSWESVGIPSAPPSLPVTVLVGRNNGLGESFLIDFWETEPNAETLASIAESPVRAELARKLAANVAVLLYAPAEPTEESSLPDSITEMVDAGIADERIGLELISVDRNDPAERLLCRFMGLGPGGPDTLCVVFGRGKLMGPPLKGDEINPANVQTLVTEIRQACSCSKPLPTMGVDVPLIWSEQVDSSVVLMDQELDLNNLETEVETMLALKAAVEKSGEPKLLSIPPGNESAETVPNTREEPSENNSSISDKNQPLVLVALAAAVLLSFAGWRSMKKRD